MEKLLEDKMKFVDKISRIFLRLVFSFHISYLLLLKRYDKGKDVCRRYIRYYDKESLPHEYLGKIYCAERKKEDATREMETAISLDPADLTLYLEIVALCYKTKDYNRVVKYGSQALDRKFSVVWRTLRRFFVTDFLWYLAYANYSLGNFEEAIQYFERLKESRWKNDTEVYSHLGYCYEKTGKKDKAIANFQRALFINEKLKFPRFELALIHLDEGEYTRSISILTSLKAQFSNDLKIISALVTAYYKNKDYGNAILHCKELIHSDSKNAINYFKLGDLYEKTGIYNEAEYYYRKGLELDPEAKKAQVNLNKIRKLL